METCTDVKKETAKDILYRIEQTQTVVYTNKCKQTKNARSKESYDQLKKRKKEITPLAKTEG
jgi:hypothetical protein